MITVIVQLIFTSVSLQLVIQNLSLNCTSLKIIIYRHEILALAVSLFIKLFSFLTCSLGGSGKASLKATTQHRNDIKTFEGEWNLVLSKNQRIPFPPLTRLSLQRGSYTEIKEHIMH